MMDSVDTVLTLWTGAFNSGRAERLRQAYSMLTVEHGRELARRALSLDDTRLAENVLLCLACINPGSLVGFHAELLKRGKFYPGEYFLHADAMIRDGLLAQLDSNADPDSVTPSHLLIALAWIGDDGVAARFAHWRTDPPAWRSYLHIPPEDYAHEAGWELTTNGLRRSLFHEPSYALVQDEGKDEAGRGDNCRWCEAQLITLFDLDLHDARLSFLDLDGIRLRIATCPRCVDFGTVFTDVDWQGASQWSNFNLKPPLLRIEEIDPAWLRTLAARKKLGERRTTPYVAQRFVADWLGLNCSQIGGHPSWVEDAEYPSCPSCQRTMTFIAQFTEAVVSDGLIYSFLCSTCGIAATRSQYS